MNRNSQTDTQLDTITRFLASMSEDAPDWHLYTRLLHHGRPFLPATRKPDDVVRGVQGFCFANCQMALREYEGVHPGRYRYAEGFAVASDALNVPIHHAWLIDAKGRAVDCTWKNEGSYAYLGFTFATRHVLDGPNRTLGDPLFQDSDVLSACFSQPLRCRSSQYPLIEELASLAVKNAPGLHLEPAA